MESGSRTSSPLRVEAAGAGVAVSWRRSRALQAPSLAEAGPEPKARARVCPPSDMSVRRPLSFGQTRPRQMLLKTLLLRPPAGSRALPPLAPPAARSARSSAHRPILRETRARARAQALRGCRGTT